MNTLMKARALFLIHLVAVCFATSVRATGSKATTICSGAAILDNGSVVTIGQPFISVAAPSGGFKSVSSGLLPTLLPPYISDSPLLIGTPLAVQSGQFQFHFSTQPARIYVVQASTNLVDWSAISTNTGTWTGLLFADSQAGRYRQRFYRVALSPSLSSGGPIIISPSLTMHNGRFQFDFATQPGRIYVVQASTNLSDWTPVWTNIGTWNGLLFEDAQAGQYRSRFYRVKSD